MPALRSSLLAASIALLPFAAADDGGGGIGPDPVGVTERGSIAIGHPVTGVLFGVTEYVAPCDPESAWNGFDGVWYRVAAPPYTTFILTMDGTLDADVWLYSAGCELMDGGAAARKPGETEVGALLPGVAFVIVDGNAGTGAFSLSY